MKWKRNTASLSGLAESLEPMFTKGIGPDNVNQSLINSIYDAVYPVGTVKLHPELELPNETWLWLDGRTVGDASSNATARANADAYNIFVWLWTNFDDTTAPILTSGGAASTRGASAAADWTAHKQIRVAPKTRGRVFVGMDDYGEGGTAANAITDANADVLGGAGGEEKHALSQDENGQHNHALSTAIKFESSMTTGGGNNVVRTTSGTAITIGNSGLGTAHNNLQPWTAVKWAIRFKTYS